MPKVYEACGLLGTTKVDIPVPTCENLDNYIFNPRLPACHGSSAPSPETASFAVFYVLITVSLSPIKMVNKNLPFIWQNNNRWECTFLQTLEQKKKSENKSKPNQGYKLLNNPLKQQPIRENSLYDWSEGRACWNYYGNHIPIFSSLCGSFPTDAICSGNSRSNTTIDMDMDKITTKYNRNYFNDWNITATDLWRWSVTFTAPPHLVSRFFFIKHGLHSKWELPDFTNSDVPHLPKKLRKNTLFWNPKFTIDSRNNQLFGVRWLAFWTQLLPVPAPKDPFPW